MIYSDTSTKQGILQHVEMKIFGDNGYGAITNDTDRLYQFAARANRALDRFAYLAMTADGRWQWDDTNYSDMSIATTDLVINQRDYTFALDHLEIEKVIITDINGKDTVIRPIDQNDTDVNSYLENNLGNNGTPIRYDKRGTTLFLDPLPSYGVSAGLKIYFKRGPSYFNYDSTTKQAGFPSVFHGFIPLHMSLGYSVDRNMPNASNLYKQLQDEEMSIKKHFSGRNRDEKPAIRIVYQNNK